MISARCGDDSLHLRPSALQPIEVDEAPADLEGADWGVIFVLDHDLYACARLKQRPSLLRGRRYAGAYKRKDALKLGEAKQGIAQRGNRCGHLLTKRRIRFYPAAAAVKIAPPVFSAARAGQLCRLLKATRSAAGSFHLCWGRSLWAVADNSAGRVVLGHEAAGAPGNPGNGEGSMRVKSHRPRAQDRGAGLTAN